MLTLLKAGYFLYLGSSLGNFYGRTILELAEVLLEAHCQIFVATVVFLLVGPGR